MPRSFPADELAETLAELDRLTRRADKLRALILQNPDLGLTGLHTRATVVRHTQRVFDSDLLPGAIRDDPRYFRDDSRDQVQLRPATPSTAVRPGWPIRREVGAALH